MRVLSSAVGFLVVLGTFVSVTQTLVTPRAMRSKLPRIVRVLIRAPYQFVADRMPTERLKDRVLAPAAPVAMLFLLVIWLLLFLLGYGLLEHGVSDMPLTVALREAGSSVLTLGFASVDRGQLTAVDFCAAATGPIVIGLQIGYLPTLYAAYARREAEVSLLRIRGGVPSWGPQLLARHAQVDLVDTLPDLFRDWERWSAEVSESHTNHPGLIHFRSPSWERNWLISLLAVLDAAALHLAFNPTAPQTQMRVTLRAGFNCLRDLAHEEGIAYDPDPLPEDPIELTYEEFLEGVVRMRERGVTMARDPEQAWPHFRGWRVNYEAVAYALAYRIDAVPAPWSGPRRRGGGPVEVPTPVDRKPADG
ncbi:hypothetical protein M8Z33_05675 [Streptomyces sp. ZAF1911]|uniref:hypothetical protein n=1 Tax=Streptomyces sp. ZAF1911 TaxID=2944129 RepID=UPI00237A57DD|nr:hypothetical protein [Streptomyces sp. ZAF1911]MDD9376164.1 hypothetical protein [Streptomyces sp. ZAF1911]